MTTAEQPDEVTWQEMTAVGITYRQLDYWTRAGYIVARDCHPGSGRQRRFPADEVPVAAIMARLVDAGVLPADAERVARGNPLAAGIEIRIDGLTVDEFRAARPFPAAPIETTRGEDRAATRCGQESGGEPAESGPPPLRPPSFLHDLLYALPAPSRIGGTR